LDRDPRYTSPRPLPKIRPRDCRAGASLCVVGLAAALLAGCAVSIPMGSLVAKSDEDVTGSIAPSLIELLTAEDWRRARAALDTALDPQGAGTRVAWDNPDSGAKGTFTPVGQAYPADSKVCRAFLAQVASAKGDRSVTGTACADKSGDWAIVSSKTMAKG
jgi:surface antigen